MGRAGGSNSDISLAGSWSDSLLDEVMRGKLSRGRANSAERETYYAIFDELWGLAKIARGMSEQEAAEGAAFGVAAAGAILMSIPTPEPKELLDEALDPLNVAEALIAAAEPELKRKRSDAEARAKLQELYEQHRDRETAFERAYAQALVAAAAALGGIDGGDPKQIVVTVSAS